MERLEFETTPPQSPARPRFLRAYAAMLLGRTPSADDLTTSPGIRWAFPAIGLVMWLMFDRWRAGPGAQLAPYAVFTWSWYLVVLFTATLTASRLARPRVDYDRLLMITAAFAPVIIALHIGLLQSIDDRWRFPASIAVCMYGAFYLSRALRSLTLRPQPLALSMVIVILCGAAWLTQSAYLGAGFWYPTQDEPDAEGSNYMEQMRQSEALLFSQPARIDAAVQAVQRPELAPAAAFFVGFAGMGEQRVFAGEIALAQKVIAEKFGSGHRSVRLVNDRRDLETLPLASPTALRYTLKAIAGRMRIESDVVFVALSSHGSEEGELSVSNGMLSLNDLSANELADALHESGIKWKVVIVSACYAGKFIEPLRDDDTIVIAAAAADRTSFGCSDDRELTYFGEAFYRDSLPVAASLEAAFEQAAAAIAVRERAEGKRASNPQAHFGPALVAHLQSTFSST